MLTVWITCFQTLGLGLKLVPVSPTSTIDEQFTVSAGRVVVVLGKVTPTGSRIRFHHTYVCKELILVICKYVVKYFMQCSELLLFPDYPVESGSLKTHQVELRFFYLFLAASQLWELGK